MLLANGKSRDPSMPALTTASMAAGAQALVTRVSRDAVGYASVSAVQ